MFTVARRDGWTEGEREKREEREREGGGGGGHTVLVCEPRDGAWGERGKREECRAIAEPELGAANLVPRDEILGAVDRGTAATV